MQPGGSPGRSAPPDDLDEFHNHDQFYEMVSNAGIPPHSEIFNTYGETLTNAQLLNQYGFILDVNENDRISWSINQVVEILYPEILSADDTRLQAVETVYRTALAHIPSLAESASQSELVYYETNADAVFSLNDEGKVSLQLWTLLLCMLSQRDGNTIPNTYEMLRLLLDLQLSLELSSDDDHDKEIGEVGPLFLRTILAVAKSITVLCSTRKKKTGKPGSYDIDLSEVLEVRRGHYFHRD